MKLFYLCLLVASIKISTTDDKPSAEGPECYSCNSEEECKVKIKDLKTVTCQFEFCEVTFSLGTKPVIIARGCKLNPDQVAGCAENKEKKLRFCICKGEKCNGKASAMEGAVPPKGPEKGGRQAGSIIGINMYIVFAGFFVMCLLVL